MKRAVKTSLAALMVLAMLAGLLYADEPKYTNPNPTFKPIPMDQAARMATDKLGKPPQMTADQKQQLAKGEVLVIKISDEGDKKRYEAWGMIDASPKAIMAFMSDYPAKLGIFPNLKDVKATWNGNMATADMTLKVALSTIRYRMNFRHYGDYFIEFEYVQGDIKDTHGYYKFFPVGDGSKTLMVYHVSTDTGMPVPDFVVNMLTKSSMPDVFEAVRKGAKLKGK